ncbi:hypothetical protein B0J13DRAFT_615291 [Dactylonectria estremocensis]|uniref:Mitochondrial cytochrome c oxidase assembly factor n=1 Tax=Dactylonectria estremocensis TaxID=1079267 RepID=A0A9P9FI74_9HYPO|nr:hypothetical protein B0J13DRAFT_615291 [Dactylonectria estremocensis]
MGGLNLEVFKFGTYVMFPIGIMYYFGTNLDDRFAVSGFWPRPEECNKLPRDRDEIKAEYERIVARQKLRLARKMEEQRRFAEAHPELHEQQQQQQQQQNES